MNKFGLVKLHLLCRNVGTFFYEYFCNFNSQTQKKGHNFHKNYFNANHVFDSGLQSGSQKFIVLIAMCNTRNTFIISIFKKKVV